MRPDPGIGMRPPMRPDLSAGVRPSMRAPLSHDMGMRPPLRPAGMRPPMRPPVNSSDQSNPQMVWQTIRASEKRVLVIQNVATQSTLVMISQLVIVVQLKISRSCE